jgi:DNA mismatch repair protein MutS2
MTYPADLEHKLGFIQIRALLKSYCLCELGIREVDAMQFLTVPGPISTLLTRNREMLSIVVKGDAFPFTGYFDPEPLLQIIRPEGGFLEEEHLHKIVVSLRSAFDAVTFLSNSKNEFPTLFGLAETLTLKTAVLKALQSKLNDEGKVRDNATPELHRIRRQLEGERSRIRKLTDQVFRHAASQGWIPDGISPTLRDGRLVIPVLAEHKRRIKGVVVDESSTGQTIYIEPTEVLEASNELRDLELAERREVIRVLRELTTLLRENLEDFLSAYQLLAWLDLERAKAKVAIDLNSHLPDLAGEPALDWVNARHPGLVLNLRGKRNVVPLNVHLSAKDRFLLVSGPNAGGKSVCLKTVGLIQYMLQCGMLVPVEESSKMGLFQSLFIDIGDQQSIENDLSTYSSHLRNMQFFLTNAGSESLVLMDELGSGTDPNFGGGIAQAVLAELLRAGAWGVATTHYYNLKVFASQAPGIVNGAMMFDAQNLQPLFVLEIGRPGSSFALEIARKTGLSSQVLRSAEEIIGRDLAGLETLMKSVADEKLKNIKMTAELRKKEDELHSLISEYETLSAQLESRKKEIIEKAKLEATGLLRETNKEIEKTIRHIKENRAERTETRKARQNLKALEAKVKRSEDNAKREVLVEPLKEGDKVRMRGQEVTGTLQELKGKNAVVQFGNIRSHVRIEQLVRSDQSEPVEAKLRPSTSIDIQRRQSEFSGILDIRGRRVDEVLPLITQFIDDAVLLGQAEVRILHGKGEGVLRKVIRDNLRRVPHVAAMNDEHADRGGAGITVVILK